jgi:hypothetical protein
VVRPRAPDWTWRLAADPLPAASPTHRRALDRDGLKGGAAGADSGDFRRSFPPVKLSALVVMVGIAGSADARACAEPA